MNLNSVCDKLYGNINKSGFESGDLRQPLLGDVKTQVLAKVKEERVKAKITQMEMAHRLGIQQGYYSRMENGAHNIDFLDVILIANALGVKPSKLME